MSGKKGLIRGTKKISMKINFLSYDKLRLFDILSLTFFIPLYDNGSPFICNNQVGFTAGGYSSSPRSLLTSYFLPLFQD